MRIFQIQDEGMERASVLSDNFLKHAGGVHIKARDDTDGQCVDHQLLDFFLRPGYTDLITTIPNENQSKHHVALTATTLTAYLDTLPDAKPPGRTPRQLALMCVDLQLNMYALDADSHCFLKITQFAGRYHHALCFYAVHKHFSLIVHPDCIKSIAEACKDAHDARGFQSSDQETHTDPLIDAGERAIDELLQGEPGHYVLSDSVASTLHREVYEYMERTGNAVAVQVKDHQIIGFTATTINMPKPVPVKPVKPLRKDFDKHTGGEQYQAAKLSYEKERAYYERERAAFKDSKVAERVKHRFSLPNAVYAVGTPPTEAIQAVCDNGGIPFDNQSFCALSLGLAHKTDAREKPCQSTVERLFAEQEAKCAKCEAAIKLGDDDLPCHCDHIIALANGGTNDESNLQLLCVCCHAEKTLDERADGYGKTPDYNSQFTPSVYEDVLPNVHPLPAVEMILNDFDGKPLARYDDENKRYYADWQIDFVSQYPSLMRHRHLAWPKYSVMDGKKPFSGTLQQGGWYFVVTKQTFPFRGSTYYSYNFVTTAMHHRLMTLEDIRYEYVPSATLAPDHFVPYLDRIEAGFDDLKGEWSKGDKVYSVAKLKKQTLCSFVGAMASTQRKSEWARTTLSPQTAASWTIEGGFVTQPYKRLETLGGGIRYTGTLPQLEWGILYDEPIISEAIEASYEPLRRYSQIYLGQFEREVALESSACFIRWEVLDASTVAMFQIEYATKSIGGTPVWRKTDAIGGDGPCPNIEEYFYDDARTAPMLHHEEPSAPKDERKPREVRVVPERLKNLEYQWSIDNTYDGDAEAMATKLVDQRKGFFLNGRAGTGKTTLANAIIDVLEVRNISFGAFSTTHVSKKQMGSCKSVLRTQRNAHTIDSLYRRWRHNQHFVIRDVRAWEYLLVDEVGMMREKFYAMLCHLKRAIPGLKIILIGDYLQFKPVKDSWEGDYMGSQALFDLCDGRQTHLTKCLREASGRELYDLCTDLINGKQIDIARFAPTEETEGNIVYYHKTRMAINEREMTKAIEGLDESKLIRLEATIGDEHSQPVALCEGMPVICIRKSEALDIDNGERFRVLNFTDVPEYSTMNRKELRQHCRDKHLKVGGKKAVLIERLQVASSDLRLQLESDEEAEPVTIPRHLFQKHFYVAYAITYYQSQGCTLEEKRTLHDWDGYHVDWRARYVALSRFTDVKNVQIAPP